jgi:hypothetical protein
MSSRVHLLALALLVFVAAPATLAAVAPAAASRTPARHRHGSRRHTATRRHRRSRHASRSKRVTHPPAATGYDISYPQCGRAYPSGQAFGVVGVNGGLANNADPCLTDELAWARSSPGLTTPSQPPASLYENTADPGNGVGDWPTPANGSAGGATPYGSCDGSWSQACAYVYGQQRAAYSYGLVASSGSAVNPATAPWWLDVETINSWASAASNPNWAAVNVAAVQGFVAGLRGAGATAAIGFYSTASQWQAITGQTAQTSPSYFSTSDPDWVAGAGSSKQAQANCRASFSGGRVALAQFTSNGFDADLACS